MNTSGDLPVLVETASGRHVPFDDATVNELGSYAITLMEWSILEAKDAVETADEDGRSAVTDELMRKSTEHFAQRNALLAHRTEGLRRPE